MQIKNDLRNKRFDTKKINLISVVLLCVCLIFVFFPISQKAADSTYTTDTNSYVMIDEIWNGETFIESRLNTLLQYVTGNDNLTVNNIKTNGSINQTLNSEDIRNEGTWNTNNYGDSSAMATNDSYVDWANDYLWLPSMAETGWCDEHNGIWRAHTNQRRNDSSYTWLRSGDVNIGNNAYDLVPEGNNYFYGVVDTSRAVRPAIHLNLNEAARNSSSLTEETVWNGLFSEQPSLQDSSQANSESNPYIIDTASKLAYLSKNSGWASNKYFLQTVEINLNSEPWTPINNAGYSYTYYYDRGNHSISNLYVNTAEQELTSNNYIGLFGYVYGSSSSHAYIKNFNIDSGSIAGSRYIGAFVGYAGYLDVINCSNSGVDVNATSGDAGGIIGYNILGKIINCSNAASITSVTLNVRCFCVSFG